MENECKTPCGDIASCDHDPSKKIKILVKLLFLFSIIVFNFMKLLFTFFMIELFDQINVFKKVKLTFPAIFFI